MEFNYNQKMAIVKLLLDIISVDGKIDSRETFLFEKIKVDLGLNPEDHFKAYEYNTLLCLSIIKAMTPEQKKHYSELMVKMILADEEIAPNEKLAYDDICDFCGIEKSL